MCKWSTKCFAPIAVLTFFISLAYGVFGLIIHSMLQSGREYHGTWPLNEKNALNVLMIGQIICILTSVVGFGGIIFQSFIVWYFPGFVLFANSVLLTIIGGVTLNESTKDFQHLYFKAIEKERFINSTKTFQWLSSIQYENNCCGVFSYKDYSYFNFSEIGPMSVPSTCCLRTKMIPPSTCGLNILAPEKSLEEIEIVLISNGCGKIMSNLHGDTLKYLGQEMLTVGLLCFLFAVLLYTGIFCVIRHELLELDSVSISTPDDVSQLSQSESCQLGSNEGSNLNVPIPPPRAGCLRRDRRVFRTKRHGGGESIVSFAIDVDNNNSEIGPIVTNGDFLSRGIKGRVAKGRGKVPTVTKKSIVNKGKIQTKKLSHPRPCVDTNKILALNHDRKEESLQKQMEMLFKPRENHSIMSTTPYPSNSSNFIEFVRHDKNGSADFRSFDSDFSMKKCQPDPNYANNKPIGSNKLTHYSSLPHVYTPALKPSLKEKSNDGKNKVFAELKNRFPTNSTPIPHPQNITKYLADTEILTQPENNGKISPNESKMNIISEVDEPIVPCANFIDGKFPSVAIESNLDTIHEENESLRNSLLKAAEREAHVSIFEIFPIEELNGGENYEKRCGVEDFYNGAKEDGTEESYEKSDFFQEINSTGQSRLTVINEELNLKDDEIESVPKIEGQPMDNIVYLEF